jgi:hypothetical protein
VYSRIPTQLKKQMLELTRLVEIYDYASALPKLADLTARLI